MSMSKGGFGPAAWVELVRLAARDRTDAAIAKPEPPFVRVDELGGQFPGMPGAPSHGQNRGLAVGAADQAPRACDSAHGLTGKERAISRLAAPGSQPGGWLLRESPANRTPQRYRARRHSFGPSRLRGWTSFRSIPLPRSSISTSWRVCTRSNSSIGRSSIVMSCFHASRF